MRVNGSSAAAVAAALIVVLAAQTVRANGGPFVVKYPKGDPAAKGVLARLDPTLKPARETRLRVVKEDLTIQFGKSPFTSPVARVTADYTIENPTDEKIDVDFGFPILRGIYVPPMSMVRQPDVTVRVDTTNLRPTVISNSIIYGIIRQRAREAIERHNCGIHPTVPLLSLANSTSRWCDRLYYGIVWRLVDVALPQPEGPHP